MKTEIINDFTINVATINGTGSQTSNIAILRAMFRMGIPVSGKNLFPSNIQGMPTWYRLRVNKDGYTAFVDDYQIAVLMNRATAEEDHKNVAPGGVVFCDEAIKLREKRDDLHYYYMPVKKLVSKMEIPSNLKDYIANMVYVGFLIEFLGIEKEEIHRALQTHFKGKEKPVALNMKMVDLTLEWIKENGIEKSDPYRVERIEGGNKDLILVEGNEAAALGSIFGGVNVVAWYPITPSTSLVDHLNKYLPKLRKDPETGKPTYAVIQSEDELAAAGIIVGAGWAGARAMTATSGPGISLMAEFAGLAYFAEVPCVIWDIQRVGPSTGLPTRTSQGDLLFAYYLSHGDTKHIVLLPNDPKECFEFGYKALDIADKYQTLVFVLSDLELGMNLWMSQPFEYPETPIERGKIISAEKIAELGAKFGRYADLDGDGIPYRPLPGTDHPFAAYFTRGTGHDIFGNYSERPDDWENNLLRIKRKIESSKSYLPQPVLHRNHDSSIGIISYGTNHPAIVELLDKLEADGKKLDYLRVRALPPADSVKEFIEKREKVFVIENNRDGQLCQILRAEFPQLADKLIPIARCNGLPLSPQWISQQLAENL